MKQRKTPQVAPMPENNELAIGPDHCRRSVPGVFSILLIISMLLPLVLHHTRV